MEDCITNSQWSIMGYTFIHRNKMQNKYVYNSAEKWETQFF